MPLQAVQSPLAQFYSEQTALTDPAERFVFERVPRRDVWFQFKGESPMLAAPESVVAPGRWDGVKLERRRTLTLIPGEITEARPL